MLRPAVAGLLLSECLGAAVVHLLLASDIQMIAKLYYAWDLEGMYGWVS